MDNGGVMVAVVVVAGAGCLFLADRLLLWAEGRGWIYYRRIRGRPGALVEELSPAAQVLKQSMEQERVRKNVRPADGGPHGPGSGVAVDLDSLVARVPGPVNTHANTHANANAGAKAGVEAEVKAEVKAGISPARPPAPGPLP